MRKLKFRMKNPNDDRFNAGVLVRTIKLPQGGEVIEVRDNGGDGVVRILKGEKTVIFTELVSVSLPLSPEALQTVGRIIVGQLP